MYITDLHLNDFRGVARTDIDVLHPDRHDAEGLELPNINLLLGQNGGGKSTLLKGILVATLGPGLGPEEIPEPILGSWPRRGSRGECRASVGLLYHPVDSYEGNVASRTVLEQRPTGARGQYTIKIPRVRPSLEVVVASAETPALRQRGPASHFLVAYGPSRRVLEERGAADGWWSGSDRLRRVSSLLESDAPLVPLEPWLRDLRPSSARAREIVRLVDGLLPAGVLFRAERERGAYLYEQRGVSVPRGSLSDGLQSYLAWVSDLVLRLHEAAGRAPLTAVPGVVLVDEVDQRIHPRWQQSFLSRLSGALPRLQFIMTAHSPLLAGGLRPENLILLEPDADASGVGATRANRLHEDVFGGTADQVLTSSYFSLESSRSHTFRSGLRDLVLEARHGDPDAALEVMRRLASAGRSAEMEAATEAGIHAETSEIPARRRPLKKPSQRRSVRRGRGES